MSKAPEVNLQLPHTCTCVHCMTHTDNHAHTQTAHAAKDNLIIKGEVRVKAKSIRHIKSFIPHLLLYYKYVQVQ